MAKRKIVCEKVMLENWLGVVLLKLHLTKGLSGELLSKSPFIHTATVPEMFQRK